MLVPLPTVFGIHSCGDFVKDVHPFSIEKGDISICEYTDSKGVCERSYVTAVCDLCLSAFVPWLPVCAFALPWAVPRSHGPVSLARGVSDTLE